MNEAALDAIRDVIQDDPNNRGLCADPDHNLINACPGDFRAACHSVAQASKPAVAVVTGFFIAHGNPPCGETDGPLGAVFLARALMPLGIRIALVSDAFCLRALKSGLAACGLEDEVPILTLPPPAHPWEAYLKQDWLTFVRQTFGMTHLVALERVGPSHTMESMQGQLGETFEREVPPEHRDRCHSMRGVDITAHVSPAHLLFEAVRQHVPEVTTIGIGDGGNEIGMGKIAWDVIRRNIPRGGLIACRVPTDDLIVCGVSNWGAYALAAGVYLLRGLRPPAELFDPGREEAILKAMVEAGPLVDGPTGQQTATVDGLSFDRYAEPLRRMACIT
jgi:hypothetical protein